MNKKICVYSSSSKTLDRIYYDFAEALGKKIGERGDTLVFGAGTEGMMGATARGAKTNNGRIIGVIPEVLNVKGIVYEECDELIVTPEMRMRKRMLDESSDVLIALPGGFGTLEEVLEVITSKQLGYHQKPIVIFNFNGHYDSLLKQFDECYDRNFAKPVYKTLYFVAKSIDEAFDYIDNYTPNDLEEKYS